MRTGALAVVVALAAGCERSPGAPENADAPELLCRGGTSIRVETRYELGWGGPHPNTNASHYRTTVRFAKSKVAAGPRGDALAPGTCAFAVRALSEREPAMFVVADSSWVKVEIRWTTQDGGTSTPELGTILDELGVRQDRVVAIDARLDGDAFQGRKPHSVP